MSRVQNGGALSTPVTFWAGPSIQSTATIPFASPANTLQLCGIVLPCAVQFNKIIVRISANDAVNLYDVGIYSSVGALLAHRGAATVPATGIVAFSMIGGPFTLQPGRYYLGWTGTAITATFISGVSGSTVFQFLSVGGFGASASGVLPVSITPPADSVVDGFNPLWALSI
jgi:hypothetical protein